MRYLCTQIDRELRKKRKRGKEALAGSFESKDRENSREEWQLEEKRGSTRDIGRVSQRGE